MSWSGSHGESSGECGGKCVEHQLHLLASPDEDLCRGVQRQQYCGLFVSSGLLVLPTASLSLWKQHHVGLLPPDRAVAVCNRDRRPGHLSDCVDVHVKRRVNCRYAPRKNMKLCELYRIDELVSDQSYNVVPSLSCHPRENMIMLSFPNGHVVGLSLWDKYTHLGRGMTSASPRQVPFRAFYEGTTEKTMAPLTLPLIHFFTNYELELKNNRPNPKFLVNYRGMREQWSHFLVDLPSAVHGSAKEAVVVRADGLKVSEDGMDVVLFLRPEASEKRREMK